MSSIRDCCYDFVALCLGDLVRRIRSEEGGSNRFFNSEDGLDSAHHDIFKDEDYWKSFVVEDQPKDSGTTGSDPIVKYKRTASGGDDLEVILAATHVCNKVRKFGNLRLFEIRRRKGKENPGITE